MEVVDKAEYNCLPKGQIHIRMKSGNPAHLYSLSDHTKMNFLWEKLTVQNSSVSQKQIDLFRWRLLLTLSLVNGLYIVTGFLLNFKEISRLFYKCCEFEEPFLSELFIISHMCLVTLVCLTDVRVNASFFCVGIYYCKQPSFIPMIV
jgi:hypothetical protein